MLPRVDLSKEELQKLLDMTLIGDVSEYAGEISMHIFKDKQLQHPEYRLEGVDEQIFEKALIGQNLQGIPFDKQQKFLMLSSDRQQFKRAIISQVVADESNSLGLEDPQKILIQGSLSISPLFDQFFIEWRERVIYSDLGKRFLENPNLSTKLRKEHNLLTVPYVFSVIKQEGDTYSEEALIYAFPVIVKRIIEELQKLADDLTLHDGDVEIIDYLHALIDLYANEDPSRYEYFSKDLDALWIRLDDTLVPIHSMEVYEDPGKYIVSPEFGLAFLDDRFKHVNEGIKKTKKEMITYLKNRYPDVESITHSIPLMERAKAFSYAMIAEAGARLTLRPFGQNIPNWDDIRFKEGVRIFIMMETAKTRWIGERKTLIKFFGEETVRTLIDPNIANNKMFDYAGIIAVGGHEIGHNALLSDDTQDRLTPPLYAKLEENKANLSILSAIDTIYSEEELRLIALYEIGYSFMKMQQIDEPSVIAYVYVAYLAINIFFKVGIVKRESDHYSIDLSSDNLQAWVNEMKGAFDAVVEVYDKGSAEDAQKYIDTYFSKTNTIQDVIQILNS